MSDKYKVAPGLFVGSREGDIDREIKVLVGKLINGDESAKPKIRRLQDERRNLLRLRPSK